MDNKFGERVRELRKQRNITQAKLGEFLGLAQQSIAAWETGRAYPDVDGLISLSKLFDVSTDYLLGIADDPSPAAQPSELIFDKHAADTTKQMTDEQLAAALPDDVREAVMALIRIEKAKETK